MNFSSVQFKSTLFILHGAVTLRRTRKEKKMRKDDKLRQGYKNAVLKNMIIQFIIHYHLIQTIKRFDHTVYNIPSQNVIEQSKTAFKIVSYWFRVLSGTLLY